MTENNWHVEVDILSHSGIVIWTERHGFLFEQTARNYADYISSQRRLGNVTVIKG